MDISELEFYNIIAKHVVAPHSMPDPSSIEKNNNIPDDFDKFEEKYFMIKF